MSISTRFCRSIPTARCVARGDMGVEAEYERLPGLQKRFIRGCYAAGKMAITATQMLESMVYVPPCRPGAEITDVAGAVFDGTCAVMLSGESAAGEYPVEAVRAMARIAEQAEGDAFAMDVYHSLPYDAAYNDNTNAICDAACTTARDARAKAIIAVTKYGQTARGMSKFRPLQPIIAATPVEKAFHQLSLSWGVYPVPRPEPAEHGRIVPPCGGLRPAAGSGGKGRSGGDYGGGAPVPYPARPTC